MDTSLLHRREGIILSTIEAFDELGIQGVSTREIARRQGISEGAIFKHFKSKNELMLSVLEHYSQFDDDLIASAELKGLSPKDAIVFLMASYGEIFQSYPQIISITESYDMLVRDLNLGKKLKDIFLKRTNYTKELIRKAQELGEINLKIDCEMLSDIIWATFRSTCAKWKYNNYSFSLKTYVISTVEVLIKAFSI